MVKIYYDVNSLYPYVSLQDIPGLTCNKIKLFINRDNLDWLFRLFYCKIQSHTNSYLALLPVINKLGINFPLGIWEGRYF
jgi:hypothetical protein